MVTNCRDRGQITDLPRVLAANTTWLRTAFASNGPTHALVQSATSQLKRKSACGKAASLRSRFLNVPKGAQRVEFTFGKLIRLFSPNNLFPLDAHP
jgi:hypothetical protein